MVKSDELEDSDDVKAIKKGLKFGFFSLVIVMGIVMVFGAFFIVSPGERAFIIRLGEPQSTIYSEGVHFKVPIIDSKVIMDIKTQKYETDASAASSDLQTVTAKIVLNYHINSDDVIILYKTVGLDYSNKIIQPLEQEVIKATTAKYTAEELITKREFVREEIKNVLRERLQPRGITLEEISITNFDFSKSFNEAIEQKVVSQQMKLKADIELQTIRIETEQKIAKAQGEAEALRLQKEQVSPELIQLRQVEVASKALDVQSKAVDKWDGKLSQVSSGNVFPFIDISSNIGGLK